MKYKDQRLKFMSEILNGIKVLKFYAWEENIEAMVSMLIIFVINFFFL